MTNITTSIAYNLTNRSCSHGFGHSLNHTFADVIASYFIVIVCIAATFNVLLIHTIIWNKTLHSSTNVFMVNLAICDVITALTTLPFDAYFLLARYYGLGQFVCGLKETVFMFSLPSAILNLLLLTFDRFILIVFPHKHKDLFTRRNIYVVIIATWFYNLTIAFLPLIFNSNAVTVGCGVCYILYPLMLPVYHVLVNFTLPLVSILGMNLAIYQVAKKHGHKHKKNSVRVNFRAAKIIMILCGVCLFCWLTYIVMVMSNIMCNVCHPRWLTWSGNAINYSSIALNPILYGLLNKKIRNVLLEKYCRCFRRISDKPKHDELVLMSRSIRS